VAVVGGGILGLTLTHRLSAMGHRVDLIEAAPVLGGLARAQDYGEFTWDRFYHVIAPQDRRLVSLLEEIGLGSELRWTSTGTGYFSGGRFYPMSSNADLLRFPLLSILDKARLGAAVLYATRLADPMKLYRITARDWLVRICGRNAYEVFWQPLLRAKFGSLHQDVAAVFIWATLKRLYEARARSSHREKLGYCSGGYRRVLERLREVLAGRGVTVRLGEPVSAIRSVGGVAGAGGDGRRRCEVVAGAPGAPPRADVYDQVFFTAPTRLARKLVSPDLAAHVDRIAETYPTGKAYLGVACLVLVLKKPLTPYYVLNIGDPSVKLTGLIEMTNLVDPRAETAGRSLVYLPQYADSDDPLLQEPDEALLGRFLGEGVRRLFPGFDESDVVARSIHRERYVQALPTVRHQDRPVAGLPALEAPFQVLNTSMLTCATLNNDEVVGLANDFVQANHRALLGDGATTPPAAAERTAS
jgi:protoporphyrinogen oxidase